MAFTLALMAMLGAGLTATLSPCGLPLLPGYVGVLLGSERGVTAVARVGAFAVGVIGTFVALGLGVFAVGASTGADARTLMRAAGVAVVGFGIVALVQRTGRWGGQLRLVQRLPAGSFARPLVLGVGCGAAWTPCVGPLLGAALSAAAASGSTARSALLLSAYATGVLAPFVAVAALGDRAASGLARSSRWRRTGRTLGATGAFVMLIVGTTLAFGWYEAAVRHLVR